MLGNGLELKTMDSLVISNNFPHASITHLCANCGSFFVLSNIILHLLLSMRLLVEQLIHPEQWDEDVYKSEMGQHNYASCAVTFQICRHLHPTARVN